jgi:ABC-2 type transport system ATP-binding protein
MSAAIELVNISKVYRRWRRGREVRALQDVSLRVETGEIFGFLGANGAGKTTTVKILLGLARPTQGHARVFGCPPGGATRLRIGYLPEAPYFYDFLTPVELMTFYARIFGIPGPDRRKRINEVLESVGIASRQDTVLRTFSKGMTQRVGLAQALLNDPDVLLLDEPTSGLDPLARREIRDIILGLKERGKTVFLNSHLLSEVELICDRVAILKRGRLMRTGTVDELVAKEGVEIVADTRERSLPTDLHALIRPEQNDDPCQVTLLAPREAEVPRVLRALLDAEVPILSVNPHRDTLEDVFVRIEQEA